MPTLLVGVLRYPVQYSPWYIYTATLVASPAAFTYLDQLFPDASGNFDRQVTTDAVVTTGYAFALEAQATLTTSGICQVVVPGSAVPMIADNSLRPCCLVKGVFGGGVQTITIAAAADLAAGKVLGRFLHHHIDHENIRITATNDIVIVLTGAC